jgi:hypothetical protein
LNRGQGTAQPTTTFALLALAATLAAAGAQAQTGKTREEVKAELAEAIRTGNIIANGESGLTFRELYPQKPAGVPGVARERRCCRRTCLAIVDRHGVRDPSTTWPPSVPIPPRRSQPPRCINGSSNKGV